MPNTTLNRFAALFLPLAVLCTGCGGDSDALLCYVGGTMRPAMERLAKQYKEKTGQAIEIDYADSGGLLIKIKQTQRGDLYICHDPFSAVLAKDDMAHNIYTVATLTPMIAVPKGNPKKIAGLASLAQPGIRLGLTHAEYSTLGHINPVMFKKTGLTEKIQANMVTETRTGGSAANAVKTGNLDAAIVWNAVIAARSDALDAVDIKPQFRPDSKVDAVTSATYGVIDMSCVKVTLATLKCSKKAEAARKFAEFVASEHGLNVFADFGFSPPPETEVPTPIATGPLLLHCAASMRPPVAEAAAAFTRETGIVVETNYGGSGTLLTTLRGPGPGDLYLPGDIRYIDQARELKLVADQRAICRFIPVILVQKGNPKGIQSLADLAKPSLKLGLGNADACAIGKVCADLIAKNGLDAEKLQANTLFSAVTVNALGVQLKTGQLDAAIVWDAVAAQYADSCDVVAIPPNENVPSDVAIAVLSSSTQPALATRFADYLAGDAGQAAFKKHGYTVQPPPQ